MRRPPAAGPTPVDADVAAIDAVVRESLVGILVAESGEPGRVRFANAVFARIFGYGSSHDVMAVAADDALRPLLELPAPARGERPRRHRVAARRADGAQIWLDVMISRTAWRGGSAKLLLVVDASAEMAASRTERLLREAVDGMPDSLLLFDSDDRLVFFNRRYRELYPHMPPLEELVGVKYLELVRRSAEARHIRDPLAYEDYEAYVAKRLRRLRDPGSEPYEQQTKDGRWLLVKEQVLPNGGFVSYRVDIDRQKAAEDALLKAKEEAEEANLAKSRFLAAASHDLRQPLHTMSLLQGILATRVTDPAIQPLLSNLADAVAAMGRMLDTLLDVNRLDTGGVKPEFTDFPIRTALGRLADTFSYHAAAKGLTLVVRPSHAIAHSDPELLSELLQNLLSNALKYTVSGRILVCCRRRAGMLRIEVRDSGPGIAEDQLAPIFEEFYQLDNPARDRRRGIGLGLAIVRRLASLLGCELDVRSAPGRGSTFAVSVPLGVSPHEAVATPRPMLAAASAPGQRILVVDDDDGVREGAAELLRLHGYVVATASDADEALGLITRARFRPDLLLTDYRLPGGVSGQTLADRVRTWLAMRVPVVLVTGDILSAEALVRETAHCVVLRKPVDRDELLGAIAGQLRDASRYLRTPPGPAAARRATGI